MKQTLAAEIIADQEKANKYRVEIMNLLFMLDVDQLTEARNAVNEIAGRYLIMKAETIDMIHEIEHEEAMKLSYEFTESARKEDKQM